MTPCKNRKDKRRKAKDQRIKTTGGKISTSIREKEFPLIVSFLFLVIPRTFSSVIASTEEDALPFLSGFPSSAFSVLLFLLTPYSVVLSFGGL